MDKADHALGNLPPRALRDGGSGSRRRAGRQAQAREQQLTVLGVPQVADVWNHAWGDGVQLRKDFSGIVEPTHMGIARDEKSIGRRMAWIILYRKEQLRNGLIKTPAQEMSAANCSG